MRKLNIMKTLDLKIATLSEKLQSNEKFNQAEQTFSDLDNNIQVAIKRSLPLVVTGLALFFSFILISSNSSLKKELNTKYELINTAENIIQTTNQLSSSETMILGRQPILRLDDFQQIILNSLAGLSINHNKIQLNNFDTTSYTGNIEEAKIDLKFNSFSSSELYSIFNLFIRSKMKIDSVSIRKNKNSNSLNGLFTLTYYYKNIEIED